MWQLFNVTDKKETDWNIGDIHARIFRDAAHWQVRFSGPLTPETQYDIAYAGETVWFRPFFPVTPFVAMLPQKFYLAPDMEASFKTALQPMLQMEIGRNIKTDIPLFLQKLSFEGIDTINGELCAVLPTPPELQYIGAIEDSRAGASLANIASPSLFVFSEAIVRNRSKQVYTFDRIIIYPETIGIFEKSDILIADLALIDYIEPGVFRLQTRSAAPIGYQLLTAGQKDGVGSRMIRQSAGFFKDITSMKLT
jgi:hypothetical protein